MSEKFCRAVALLLCLAFVVSSSGAQQPLATYIQGGVFVGDLGGGRGPGAAVWSLETDARRTTASARRMSDERGARNVRDERGGRE